MNYQTIDVLDNTNIPAKHRLTRRTLQYICADEYDPQLFFAADELFEVSQSPHYQASVERLKRAIEFGEKVVVYGDYDVDGISATTICYDMLTNLKVTAGYYIPNRMNDGYGLNPQKVAQFKDKGYQLIICVDNGVVAHDALALTKELGMDVIIIDHHQRDEKTSSYPYVIHPDLLEEQFGGMCGAGLVFEFSRSFLAKSQYLMLAALGTIADMMTLINENRRIVRNGLRLLRDEGYGNLSKLAKDTVIDEFTLAMQIAPKLNTLGRLPDLANTNQVVRYFMLQDESSMDAFTRQVDELNDKRKQMAKDMTLLASTMINESDPFHIVVSSEFHEGLVGLIANQLLHRYGKPVMVCQKKDGLCKGSLRSMAGLDLVAMMRLCPHILKFGGHQMAGGISFEAKYLPDITAYIHAYVANLVQVDYVRSTLHLELEDLTLEAVDELFSLRPFLSIQKEPLYMLHGLALDEPQGLSGGLHLKWMLSSDVTLIYFNHSIPQWQTNWEDARFVVKITTNVFHGRTSISLVVQDVLWD